MSDSSAITVDSHLLVLLVVGLTDIEQIARHKRAKEFERENYELLVKILERFENILLTPHVVINHLLLRYCT